MHDLIKITFLWCFTNMNLGVLIKKAMHKKSCYDHMCSHMKSAF